MSAEGSFSKQGKTIGMDDMVEGERVLNHKKFQIEGAEVKIRCLTGLPLDDAVGLLNGLDSTGLMVWDAGRAMLKELAKRDFKTMVELGAGVGLVSIAYAKLRPDSIITTTDGNEECVEAARSNIVLNNTTNVTPCILLYDDEDHLSRLTPPYGAVTASDVIYSKGVVSPLFSTAARLSPSGPFLLSYVPRAWSDEENTEILSLIMETAKQFKYKPPTVLSSDPVQAPDGSECGLTNTLYEFTR
eukprot:TRINITY_DN10388_c0_g1_i1.p1 TRINITY_DN10388_c0_g1~~TRINITY_DN10388_c0_g1_i1.p1  ORF type:complete len:261 (+),score=34.48 TRINITY_DN10388_c0_g1_i1:52-783(+)